MPPSRRYRDVVLPEPATAPVEPGQPGQPGPEPSAPATPRWGLGDVAIGLVATLAVSVVAGGLIVAAAGYLDVEPQDYPIWLQALLQVPLWAGLLGVPLWATYRKGRASLAVDFGLRQRLLDVPLGLGAGLAAQVVLLVVISVAYDLLGLDIEKVGQSAQELADRATDPVGVVLLVLIVGLGAPVFEELFYRGLTLRAIERRFGAVPAVVGSSLLFAFMHFQWYDMPALALFGLVVALLTVRTGRLGPAIWAHVAFNLTAVVSLLNS